MRKINRSIVAATAMVLILGTIAFAAPSTKKTAQTVPPMPGIFANARYVYVTSYDGDQFNPNLLPEDRQAIGSVQDAIQKWGKLTLVYRHQDADVVLMVMSRPSEDVLAVYDVHGTQYLWRMTARNGLQQSETPLVTDFQKAFEQIAR